MKLHQLRYLAAVAQSGLNITAAAQKLHTSQPGVSKQIKLLEDELGFQIFVREGRNLTRITPAGQQVIERAMRILQEAQSIRSLSTELRDEGKGSLSIGTTHTQARYVLPDVIREFRARYPQVRLNLHQGTSNTILFGEAQSGLDNMNSWAHMDNAIGVCALPPNCKNPLTGKPYPPDQWWNHYGFTSAHPGGVLFARADGSVRFITDTIDLKTFRAMGTRSGGEVVQDPGP